MSKKLFDSSTVDSLKEIKHLEYLDALRGIAVLGVILVHCTIITLQRHVIFALGFTGQRGVQLFYIISAFTLFYSMQNRKEEGRPLLNFYIRRFFRIAPLYYFVIILNLFYQGLAPRPEAPDGLQVYEVILGFLFLNGFNPDTINSIAIGGWSIAVEVSFYVLAPFLFLWITNYTRALYLTISSTFILFILSRLLAYIFGGKYVEYFNFLYFPIQFPIFCMGILTFMVWRDMNRAIDKTRLNAKHLSLFLIVLSIVIIMLSLPFNNNNMHLTSFAFILLILALSIHPWKILVNAFTLHIGRISFSIYLIHFFILVIADKIFKNYFYSFYEKYISKPPLLIAMFIFVLILSVIVCNLTYTLIEKKGIILGKKVIAKYSN